MHDTFVAFLSFYIQDDEEPEYSLITGGLIPGKQNSQEVVGKNLRSIQCIYIRVMLLFKACSVQYTCVYALLRVIACYATLYFTRVGSASSAVVQRSKMEVALEGLTGTCTCMYMYNIVRHTH